MSDSLSFTDLCTNSLFLYIYYTPLHVSSTIVLIFRRTIVLVQHLVSSLWKQVGGLYSSTCFEHYYAHLQEDSCISTASGEDRGSTVVKMLCYKSEGRWFDPSWCQWIFHWHKILPIALWPWSRLSLYQKWVPGVFPGGKGGRCVGLTTLPLSCADCLEKSGSLILLETSGSVQACNGIDLPLPYIWNIHRFVNKELFG